MPRHTEFHDATLNLLFGSIAGTVSRTATAPLELLKIRMQNSHVSGGGIVEMIRGERRGVLSLWKGNGANCVRIAPQTAINFATRELCEARLAAALPGAHPALLALASGSAAGGVSMAAIYPLENARTRLSLQSDGSHYRGLADVFRKTPARQLYQGLGTSLFGFIPYNAIMFTAHRQICSAGVFPDSAAGGLLAGGLSGCAAVTVTYPTDLIRRRQQIGGMFAQEGPPAGSFVQTARRIVAREGARGLYSGLSACYAKIFPSNAIAMYMFSQLKERAHVKN
jgi:solute carrier family 25 phosphate transporter 23/24/25/41